MKELRTLLKGDSTIGLEASHDKQILALWEASGVAFLTLDANFQIEFGSLGLGQLLGIPGSNLSGRAIFSLPWFHPSNFGNHFAHLSDGYHPIALQNLHFLNEKGKLVDCAIQGSVNIAKGQLKNALLLFIPKVLSAPGQRKDRFLNILSRSGQPLREAIRISLDFSKLLRRYANSSFEKEGKEYLEYIQVNLEKGNILLEHLALLEKLNFFSLETEKVSPEVILLMGLQKLRETYQLENVKIQYSDFPDFIIADRALMRILSNLLFNFVFQVDPSQALPQIQIQAKKETGIAHFHCRIDGLDLGDNQPSQFFSLQTISRLKLAPELSGYELLLAHRILDLHNGNLEFFALPEKNAFQLNLQFPIMDFAG